MSKWISWELAGTLWFLVFIPYVSVARLDFLGPCHWSRASARSCFPSLSAVLTRHPCAFAVGNESLASMSLMVTPSLWQLCQPLLTVAGALAPQGHTTQLPTQVAQAPVSGWNTLCRTGLCSTASPSWLLLGVVLTLLTVLLAFVCQYVKFLSWSQPHSHFPEPSNLMV